jgi:hypothetical protein
MKGGTAQSGPCRKPRVHCPKLTIRRTAVFVYIFSINLPELIGVLYKIHRPNVKNYLLLDAVGERASLRQLQPLLRIYAFPSQS